MGQRTAWPGWAGLAVATLAVLLAGCERSEPPAAAGAPEPVRPALVSLVPAVTDLMLGMGLGDHLAGVSNFCRMIPSAEARPGAGDYQTVDWERLTVLRPDVLVVFVPQDRLEAGLLERAGALGIRVENLRIQTVADVREAMLRLGEITGQGERAAAAVARLDAALAAIARTGDGQRVLLGVSDASLTVAGRGTFLAELLDRTGATNAAEALPAEYPSLDRERLRALAVDRVLLLLPGATESRARAARAYWGRQLGDEAKVSVLTQWHLLLPGYHLPETAQAIAAALAEGGR